MIQTLSLSGVTKQIGGLTAVNRVDMTIDKDQIVGLVGPNGAGKTTLLNIISGILPPTAGKIAFCSEDITGMKADRICRKGIAKTFQIAESFPNLSAEQCVMIGVLFGNDTAPGMKEAQEQAYGILAEVNFPGRRAGRSSGTSMSLNSNACSSPGRLHRSQNSSSSTSSRPASTRKRAKRQSGLLRRSGTMVPRSSSSST